jgi:hypothetical protein
MEKRGAIPTALTTTKAPSHPAPKHQNQITVVKSKLLP